MMAKFLTFIVGILFSIWLITKLNLEPQLKAADQIEAVGERPDRPQVDVGAPGTKEEDGQKSSGLFADGEKGSDFVDNKEKIINDMLIGDRNPFMPPRYILEMEYYVEPQRNTPVIDPIDGKMEAIRRWPLNDYQVLGIIWDVKSPKALVRDRNGTLHIVKKNQRIGNSEGLISEINEGELLVVEKGIPRTLKLTVSRIRESNDSSVGNSFDPQAVIEALNRSNFRGGTDGGNLNQSPGNNSNRNNNGSVPVAPGQTGPAGSGMNGPAVPGGVMQPPAPPNGGSNANPGMSPGGTVVN